MVDDVGKESDGLNSSPTKVTFGNSVVWNSGMNKDGNMHDKNVGRTPSNSTANPNKVISERFVNTAYGYFLKKRVAYPVVANYVRNTWGKYGLVKSMLNSSTRIFSFQFSSMDGLDAMLENCSWFIRNNPLILKKWNQDVNLLK
ncbi:hypothetical protein Tco_0718783 [Tanacetum coccineum]